MKAKAWEQLWRGQAMQSEWRSPDRDIVDLVPQLKQERVGRALDLGCGIGRHVILLARSGFETYGLDASEYAVNQCHAWVHAEGLEAHIRRGDMRVLPYEDEFFGFVLSWDVIYHASRKEMVAVLKEIHRILRPNGLFYVTLNTTRNRWYGMGREIEPGTFDNPEKEDGEHLHHFSDEGDVASLLAEWRIERMRESEQSLKGRVFPGSWHWMILARKR